jgi:hypothetical protein
VIALSVAEAKAILKVADEVDFVGAQEFARLDDDETAAWGRVVHAAHERVKKYEAQRRSA